MARIERIVATDAQQVSNVVPPPSASPAPPLVVPPLPPKAQSISGGPSHPVFVAGLVAPSGSVDAPRATGYERRPEVQAFIDSMVTRHGFDRAELTALIAGASRRNDVLNKISRPAEALSWSSYRPIFLTPARIEAGRAFAAEHRALLERAERTYHVPAEVIVAILGVETFYGRNTGTTPALDALLTLGFDYPPRAAFFKSELEQLLLLCREEKLDPRTLKGSYAGAFGMSQFISSSYRHYAIDFDGDGVRDLWRTADAIGSVVNYFAVHGWREGEPVVSRAVVQGEGYKELLGRGRRPSIPVAELARHGIVPTGDLGDATEVAFFEQQGERGPEYWIGLENFYVITRYNTSPLYAMAVYELGRAQRGAAAAR